ncbi:MAG: hypothetical protein AAF400_00340 [Bacteroidota bacterium]
MTTSPIKLLITLGVWLVKILSNITSKENEKTPQAEAPSPPSMPRVYHQPIVRKTIPLQRTYAGINSDLSPAKAVTDRPAAIKPSPPTPPRPNKKLAQVLGQCSSLRNAMVVSELLQPKNF